MSSVALLVLVAALSSVANAWLPAENPIRGVNLGGLFIVEPWMMGDAWRDMGCTGQKSEFDCVLALGQTAANAAFDKHWDSWITLDDITQIKGLGLNTIRVPLGYWMREDIVYADSEHFPQGGFKYLERLCGWAKDAGLYVILDLHGAPGAQQADQPFTGQYAPNVGFYEARQYERAHKFLEWMTEIVHSNANFATVGAIQIVNEPLQDVPKVETMLNSYYPTAFQRVQAVENRLGVAADRKLHLQMMNEMWGAGNPNQALTDLTYAFYDDHHYVKWTDTVAPNRDAYIRHSCTTTRGESAPTKTVVGEWSLSTADEDGSEFNINRSDAVAWYRKWWAAQVLSYEKTRGWIFWTWKVNWIGGRLEWRWGYQQAVEAGVIPANAADAHTYDACNGY